MKTDETIFDDHDEFDPPISAILEKIDALVCGNTGEPHQRELLFQAARAIFWLQMKVNEIATRNNRIR